MVYLRTQTHSTPWLVEADYYEKAGLSQAIEIELDKTLKKPTDEMVSKLPDASELSETLTKAATEITTKASRLLPSLPEQVSANIALTVEDAVDRARSEIIADIRAKQVEEGGPLLNATDPEAALFARADRVLKDLDLEEAVNAKFPPLATIYRREIPQLGIFFSESTCYRSEGLTYGPCGREFTILPGESVEEHEETVASSTIAGSQSQSVTTSNSQTTEVANSLTLSESIEDELTRTTDVSLARELSAKLKIPFTKLTADLGATSSASLDFQQIMKRVNVSSQKETVSFIDKVVRSVQRAQSSKTNFETSETRTVTRDRKWANTTESPLHFIERTPHCVYSIHHKRTNAHLAWSGCIDLPARDLCTPESLTSNLSSEIQSIRDRWETTTPPSEFGQEPSATRRETGFKTTEKHKGLSNPIETLSFTASIPPGDVYVGGSAVVVLVPNDETVLSEAVTGQPVGGSTGVASFQTQVEIENRNGHWEQITYAVAFYTVSATSQEWYDQVNQWRDTQAQAEIDALIAGEEAILEQFLLSDRAHAEIERRIVDLR